MEVLDFQYSSVTLENRQNIGYIDLNPTGKQVVVLLHGLGTNGASWQLQFDTLVSSGFRVIAPDLPGFGKSAFAGKRWSLRSAALSIADLLDTLGIVRPVMGGISLGGVVALQFALDYPQRVEKLALVNAFASLRPDQLDGWVYLLRRFSIATLRGAPKQAHVVAERLFPGPGQEALRQVLIEQIQQTDRKVYRAAMLGLGLFDARRRLKSITAPTLIISGMKDTTVPLKNQDALAAGIPGASHVYIPSAGHAVIVDQPDAFNADLIGFLMAQPTLV
jgi:3-oxoadipate enol-lactonase